MPTSPHIDPARLTAWYDFQAPFYHLWRDRGDAPAVQHVVARMASRGACRTVLDVGCGSGLYSIALASALPEARVVGIDRSRGMLRIARRQAARKSLGNCTFQQGDALRLPFPAHSFDAVVAAGLLTGLNDRAQAILEMVRVLRPTGRLCLAEFDRASLGAMQFGLIAALTAGQRLVSSAVPRFRFARNWRTDCAFVDPDELQRCVRAAGCDVEDVQFAGGHICLCAAAPDA
jgi:ubiquinone/menaquinone biosynthesis C-methylase UbiE